MPLKVLSDEIALKVADQLDGYPEQDEKFLSALKKQISLFEF